MAPTDEMMPELPEPLEALLLAYGSARSKEGEAMGLDRVYWSPKEGSQAALAANHAAYEAERALRLAILAYPHDAAFGAIARLTDEGIPPKE